MKKQANLWLYFPQIIKFDLKMKLSLLFLVTTIFTIQANNSYSQKTKISLEAKNNSISEVLDEIESTTKFRFIFSTNDIDLDRKISAVFKKAPITDVLTILFKNENVTYEILDRKILLKKEKKNVEDYIKAPRNAIKKYQFEVSGSVFDGLGTPLPGANVLEKGTSNGTQTDFDGNFSLSLSSENAVLVISYIGFTTKEVPVNGQTNLKITIEESAAALDEVVVIGYGTLKKRDVTGSIGSLKMNETLNSRATVDFGQVLTGKVAGVQVINGSGRPGASSSIQIRGVNSISAGGSPLVVIDGVQLPNYDLNSINSSDIESIEVLKDASSSSIYGSRGANGVILVTTKSGKRGKSTLNIDYTTSIQQVIKKMDVMNSSEYAQAAIDAAQNGWIDQGGDPNAPNTISARGQYKYTWPKALESPETLPNTDFQDLIFRAAPLRKLGISFSGGNEKSKYSLSAGYLNQEGIVINSDYERYTININTSTTINDWLKLGGMLNTLYDNENQAYNRTVEWAVQYPSIYPIYGNDGYLGGPLNTSGFENYSSILFRPNNGHPLYRANDDIQNSNFTTLGNLFANIQFSDPLSFKSTFSAYANNKEGTNYQAGNHDLGKNYETVARYSVENQRTTSYTWSNILTYNKTFDKHSLNLLIGQEYNHQKYNYIIALREGYDNDNFHSLAAGKKVVEANDMARETNLISYLGRLNYSFLDRYIFSASYRKDGSSRFGPENKWGDFYSFSGAWRVSDEGFMKDSKVISKLKLKASYGITGNDNFSDYKWVSTITQQRGSLGNNTVTTYFPTNLENKNLAWEGTKQLNVGFDIGVWKNRISLEVDLYTSKSNDLLLDVPVPSITGFTNAFSNIGEITNKGVEINLQTQNFIKDKFTWTTQFNLGLNRSEITRLGQNNTSIIFDLGSFGSMQKINQIGKPVFSFYGFQYDGVYMNQVEIDSDPSSPDYITPGDGRYKDINGDGILNADDRTIIGNTQPDFNWGITNNFTVGDLDVSILFQGVVGGEIYDDNAHRSLLYHEGRNYLSEVNNRWRSEENPGDGYHYKLSVDTKGLEKTASSYWIDDGSYLRLKDLTIGYKLPNYVISKLGLSHVRLFVNGANLFTIAKAPVFDPENFLNTNVSSPLYRGVGGAAYPTAKTYSIGLNVKF
ncbi:TonB-linked outer membrane protein, SusC/RagA family [Galbibacter orientalis DSM 19592]|uniref:TonB-linked outer membrane protein, SusC/RagA family n=1 Tax=Galbibacter orientalis DSM 19592 TaxID=926559 RepID=I3C4J1_9FLAO|nr:TonB-dependent receptor [Galbibacter orientalis]EIJ38534.1 TonB-linked outer membrane protein, SusC/RagA family [Galbibacter orientalis DSM 19592]